ncbi:hypothetical protein WN55_10532 [Dufourea novaeangliae]|uniref:Uncharacterized protein n=1 Tax=Dufourea novaeangliae TaxID=178035 RepID=A0A154P420_DUFNO|nr:hypothetical protein WN55_10532 [Dufourea novaeangliae]
MAYYITRFTVIKGGNPASSGNRTEALNVQILPSSYREFICTHNIELKNKLSNPANVLF